MPWGKGAGVLEHLPLSSAELKTFVLSTEAVQYKQSSSYPVLDLFFLFELI
jgi:hypothetical protein